MGVYERGSNFTLGEENGATLLLFDEVKHGLSLIYPHYPIRRKKWPEIEAVTTLNIHINDLTVTTRNV